MEHKVVSHKEWVEARKKHLVDEKELTRRRDRLSQARRDLPWEVVDKAYEFEGAQGQRMLADLFEDRDQLVIYHAMFNPDTASDETTWTKDAPCFACAFWMDNFDRVAVHLNHRDITIAAVSRAAYPKIAAYRRRAGWTFPWYSSAGSDFNLDYQVSFTHDEIAVGKAEYNFREFAPHFSEMPGISVFKKEGGKIYHTYSTYERGLDMLNVAYHYMDLVPKGRDEGEMGAMGWLKRRDEYKD